MRPSLFLKITGLLLFAGVICSLFLPFVEQPTDGMTGEDFMIEHLRQDDEGYWTTFNGFGSLFAYFNALLSFILLFVLFGKNNNYTIPRLTLWFCISSHLLVLVGNCARGYVLSPPDNLLAGYALMTFSEAGLIFTCFRIVRNQQTSN